MSKLKDASVLLSILVSFFYSDTVKGQSYYFKEYNVSDGLPFVQVETIAQDEKGFLWTGGYGGLSRFDGVEFQNYSKINGLVSTTINQVCLDESGVLWVATPKGLNWIQSDSIHTFHSVKSSVIELQPFSKGIVAFTQDSLIVISDKKITNRIQFTKNETYSSATYWNDTLWVGTSKNLYCSVMPFDTFKVKSGYKNKRIYDLWSDKNQLLVGHENGIDVLSDSLVNHFAWQDGLLGGRVLKVYSPNSDEWWAVTDLGLNVISKAENRFKIKLVNIGSNNQTRSINTFFSDSEHNTWIGTSHGLFKSTSNAFKNYTYQDGLLADFVFQITQDQNDNYWFGTREQGIFKYNGKSFIGYNTGYGLLSNEAKAIQCVGDSVLVGTAKGLNIIQNGRIKSFPTAKLPIKSVNAITTLKNGKILLGGYEGIATLPNLKESFIPLPTELNAEVWLLFQDSRDTVWVGTYQGGLYQLANGKLLDMYKKWNIPLETCLAMTEDKEGNIWIGSFEGVIKYNRTSQSIQHLTTDDGLNSNLIYTLKYDSLIDGVWVGTNQGINKVICTDKNSNRHQVISFGKDDGFTGVECNSHGCYIDKDGLLWFGTVNGLITFDQSLYTPNINENYLDISSIKLFYKDTIISNNTILPYDKNHLTITYKGICLTSPQAVRYRYRLIGLNDEWSPISSFNQATFSNLDPGNYTFEVISRNNSGIWNKIPARFSFTIKPPIWDTLFFQVSVILILILFSAALIWFRISRLQQRNSLERKIDQMKLQALRAQLNPHFIFNSLNSIQHFINANEPREANRYLSKFAKLMRLMLDNSRRNAIPIDEDISALQLYLELEELRFEDAFSHSIKVQPELEKQSVEIPPMLIQPFVENAILHAFTGLNRKGHIAISFKNEDKHIVCIVQDDGIGRAASARIREQSKKRFHRSSGIHIIEDRLSTLNEYHKEQLAVNVEDLYKENLATGTRVTIKIPIIEISNHQ